jgi:hypothetical protein
VEESKVNDVLQFLRYTDAVPMLTGIIIVGVPVLAHYWYKLRVKQWEMSLKHTMLERGMSADEIKTVLEASTVDSHKKTGCWSQWKHGGADV